MGLIRFLGGRSWNPPVDNSPRLSEQQLYSMAKSHGRDDAAAKAFARKGVENAASEWSTEGIWDRSY
jgi:hypothetical protein